MFSIIYRFRSLQTPANMIVTSLSLAGLMIIFKLPIFLVNMYLGGPHTAFWGAQVCRNWTHKQLSYLWNFSIIQLVIKYRAFIKKTVQYTIVTFSFCQMYGFASIVSGMVSIWSIMVLSLERLWVIYWATRASVIRVRMSTMRAIIVTMWLLAIIMAILPLLGYSRYVYEVKTVKRCFLGCYSYTLKERSQGHHVPYLFRYFWIHTFLVSRGQMKMF